MDFQTLNRRELQALCKLNKIPANITSIAMVDALKSLETVEGIEMYLNHSRNESVGLSIESTESTEVTSPRKRAKKMDVSELLKTPLTSCTKKKDPETLRKDTVTVQTAYSTRRSTRLTAKISEEPLQEKHDVIILDDSDSDEDSNIHKVVHVDKSGEEKVDSCGDVDNLKVKLVKIFGEFEDMDLDERQNSGENFKENSGQVDILIADSKGVCYSSEPSKLDNHNVDEVMNEEDIEENVSGNTVDVMYPNKQMVSINFEGRPLQPHKSVVRVEPVDVSLNPLRSETGGLSIESPELIEVTSPSKKTKKMEEVHELALTPLSSCPSQLTESENITSLVSKSTRQDIVTTDQHTQVLEMETSEAVNITVFSDKVIQKHDVNENIRTEKVVESGEEEMVENPSQPSVLTSGEKNQVLDCNGDLIHNNTECPNEVSKLHHPDNNHYVADLTTADGIEENISTNTGNLVDVDSQQLNSQQLNQEGDADEVTHDSFSNEQQNQFSTNENNDDIHHPTASIMEVLTQESVNNQTKLDDVVVTEFNNEKEVVQNDKAKSISTSLRELKKQLKATLTNTPTPIKMKTEVVVVEENEEKNNEKKGAEEDNKAKSVNDIISLRQLRKKVKALSGKYNIDEKLNVAGLI